MCIRDRDPKALHGFGHLQQRLFAGEVLGLVLGKTQGAPQAHCQLSPAGFGSGFLLPQLGQKLPVMPP